jgi:CHAT domain-containing protein
MVLGLQRAFQIACARSTISSLWALDGRATAELMKRLYSSRMEKGLSSVEAQREAQLGSEQRRKSRSVRSEADG